MMLISNGICQYERRYAALNKSICLFGTITERVFSEKSREQHCIICICFRALDFFREACSVIVPKMAYIFVQSGISLLILAYAILNKHHNIGYIMG